MTRRRRRFQVRHDPALASVGDRVMAKVIDGAILWVAGIAYLMLGGLISGLVDLPEDTAILWLLAGLLVLSVVYDVVFTALSGQTPGKQAVGIRVIGPDGKRPGWRRALRRSTLSVVLGAVPGPVGDVAGPMSEARFMWDKQRRGYHDLFAGTYVVKAGRAGPPRRPLPRGLRARRGCRAGGPGTAPHPKHPNETRGSAGDPANRRFVRGLRNPRASWRGVVGVFRGASSWDDLVADAQ